MEIIQLSKRLSCIAEFVKTGACVIDIGTDHGYLPVYLAQTGKAQSIIAADINVGPLARARASALEYGVTDRIAFLHTNGLEGVLPSQIDTIIIAGMGGETIQGILAASEWALHTERLILQPQSKVAELNIWLNQNNMEIVDASLVEEDARLYIIYLVSATSVQVPLTSAEMYVPPCLVKKKDPLLPIYLDKLLQKFTRAIAGIQNGKTKDNNVLAHMEYIVQELERMKGEFFDDNG